MDQILEDLLKSILLLPDERIKQVLGGHTDAFSLAVSKRIIDPSVSLKYRQLKRQIFDKEGKMIENNEEFRALMEKLIQKNRWSKWMLLLFLIVPENKYISRHFVDEVIGEWGYGRTVAARNTGKRILEHPMMTTLAGMSRGSVRLLERESLISDKYKGDAGLARLIAFCDENVHGPVNVFDNRTQSVFRLTKEGRARAELFFKHLPKYHK
ncbi:MAG: hypothetical protein OEM02_03780 [Desulfobulbaceae bacterium]|nr:hypothetical protein [Desulfobulbaceae bacterium]